MVGGKNVEKDVIGNRKEFCSVMSKVGNIRKKVSRKRWLRENYHLQQHQHQLK